MDNFLFFVVVTAYIAHQKRTEILPSQENVVVHLQCLGFQVVTKKNNRNLIPNFNSFW